MICIFCKRTCKKWKKIYDLAFKIVFKSHTSYNDPLFLICKVSIHQEDLRLLFTEIYKSATDINPKFTKDYHIIYVLAQFSVFYQLFTLTFLQIQQKFEGIY